jgi:ankyrin repeat protein
VRSLAQSPSDILISLQYAVYHGRTEVVAELIKGGADVDAAVDSDMFTALEVATAFKRIDTVRLLLKEGASQEHRNTANCSSAMLCWSNIYDKQAVRPIDLFNLLREYALRDLDNANTDGRTILHAASENVDSCQIQALVNLEIDIHHLDICGYAAINDATFYGNHSTFSALALQYNTEADHGLKKVALSPLHSTIAGKDSYLRRNANSWGHSTKKYRDLKPFKMLISEDYDPILTDSDVAACWSPPATERCGEYDMIMKDLLRRTIDTEARVNFSGRSEPYIEMGWNIPRELMGREVTARELAATYGPATEAWYLGLLHSCDMLKAPADIDRLRELNERGQDATGCVYGGDERPDETYVNFPGDVGQGSGTSGVALEACNGPNRSSMNHALDEVDHFWDAEEFFV